MDKQANKPTETAAGTYAARRADVARLMDVLEMQLQAVDERHARDPASWGHVGSLNLLRAGLIRAVTLIDGIDTDDVERFLAEAE